MIMDNLEEFNKIAEKLNTDFTNKEMRESQEFDDALKQAIKQQNNDSEKEEARESETEIEEATEEEAEAEEIDKEDLPKNALIQSNSENREVQKTEKKKEVIEDQKFIQNEFYNQIAKIGNVMTLLENGLKENSRASQFEAFSNLARTMNETLGKLTETNFKIADKEAFMEPEEQPKQTNQTLILNGNDVLDKLFELKQKKKEAEKDKDELNG